MLATHHQAAIDAVGARLGARLVLNRAIRERHGSDESHHVAFPPDAVAYVESTDEVAFVAQVCQRTGTPLIPFGAGTSLEGNVAALQGGICVDLSRMNRILRCPPEDIDVTVEARRHAQVSSTRTCATRGCSSPSTRAPTPRWAAWRPRARRARMRCATAPCARSCWALKVVLADGSVIDTGGRARKSSAGYDLTRLFVGSEGTLGIITEVSLRLHRSPRPCSVAVCQFDGIAQAVDAVIASMQSGTPVARIEILDEVQIRAINLYSKLSYAERPTLFLEFHGSDSGVEEQADTARLCTESHGGSAFTWAHTPEARSKLWQARHDALYAAVALRPGCKAWPTDVCVPISALAECIAQTRLDLQGTKLPCPIVGHVGDGNFHVIFVVDPDSADEMREVEALNQRLVRRALSFGGTCTGEHGIGSGKREYLLEEHASGVPVMRLIKAALDPRGILNPGKIFTAIATEPECVDER